MPLSPSSSSSSSILLFFLFLQDPQYQQLNYPYSNDSNFRDFLAIFSYFSSYAENQSQSLLYNSSIFHWHSDHSHLFQQLSRQTELTVIHVQMPQCNHLDECITTVFSSHLHSSSPHHLRDNVLSYYKSILICFNQWMSWDTQFQSWD